ncbi:hypothetical protein D3C85_1263570 [compost metagenome]
MRQDFEGKDLDKDILIKGNKVYGPDNCVFVSRALNTFMNDRAAVKGGCPTGVSLETSTGRFKANCRNPFSKQLEFLGRFACQDAAHEAWRKRKHDLACQYANLQTDPRIASALRTRYALNKV